LERAVHALAVLLGLHSSAK